MTEPRPLAALHSAPRSRGSLLLHCPIPNLERVDPALAGVDLHACSRSAQFMAGGGPGLSDALVLKQPTDAEALRRSGRHLLLRSRKRLPCLGLEFGQMDVERRLEEAISLLLGQTLDGDLGCREGSHCLGKLVSRLGVLIAGSALGGDGQERVLDVGAVQPGELGLHHQ
ncbi:hypothetical protein [Streptomyces sp. CB03911]|uniref:hypothetical protein n=1 Tax=Streptomyces sp. CB03911 TaxID=1804758 RepID=UPI0018FF05FD|nr:hypothetical protein [Streptomyces sp. CB03911]